MFTLRNGFFGAFGGIVGKILSEIYGGKVLYWFMLSLIIAIVIDWITGSKASKKDGSYASAYGIQGIIRTGVMLSFLILAMALDKGFGTKNIILSVFWAGLLYHTLISASANIKRIGWDKWIPTWALDWIASEIEAKAKRAQSRINGTTNNSKGDDISG